MGGNKICSMYLCIPLDIYIQCNFSWKKFMKEIFVLENYLCNFIRQTQIIRNYCIFDNAVLGNMHLRMHCKIIFASKIFYFSVITYNYIVSCFGNLFKDIYWLFAFPFFFPEINSNWINTAFSIVLPRNKSL